MHQASKAMGLSIVGDLQRLGERLTEIKPTDSASPQDSSNHVLSLSDQLGEDFRALALLDRNRQLKIIAGRKFIPPELTQRQQAHLESGLPVLTTKMGTENRVQIFMTRLLSSSEPRKDQRAALIAELNIDSLLDATVVSSSPPGAEYCILDRDFNAIGCSSDAMNQFSVEARKTMAEQSSGMFELPLEDGPYLASNWSIFLDAYYATDSWKIVLAEPRAYVLGPLFEFRTSFVLAVFFCVGLGTLLSASRIRHYLNPLNALQEGTRRIGARDFDTLVIVKSGDEFEDLAGSFNRMAKQLQRQFDALTKLMDVTRLMLSASGDDQIIDLVFRSVREFYPCDAIAIALPHPDTDERMRLYLSNGSKCQEETISVGALSRGDRVQLSNAANPIIFSLEDRGPKYLEPLFELGMRCCVVFPFSSGSEITGVVILGHLKVREIENDSRLYVQQLVNQAHLALEKMRTVEKNRLLTHFDDLTGLPNRVFFQDRLGQALLQARHGEGNVAVCLIVIDGFKRLSSTLGQIAGDQLLRRIGERISMGLEASGTAARLSGAEFAILFFGFKRIDAVIAQMQGLLDRLTGPFYDGRNEVHVTVSAGIAVHPDDGAEAEILVRNAHAAMHHVETQGGNGLQFYTTALNKAAVARFELEAALYTALERQEFRVFYQPIVDIETRAVMGAEALVRWQNAEGELICPDHFIPMAEETGQIVAIGEFVFHETCRQIKAWQERGFFLPHVSVNVSARQFRDPGLVATVKHALRDARLEARFLNLELTEGLLLDSRPEIVGTLHELRSMGVDLSIDDFGTGYSALSYLKHFPLDFLKIDRSFVKDILVSPGDAALVQAITAMAHSLSLRIIVEGIENEEQLAFVREIRCEMAQGYLFSAPMPPDEFEKWLRVQAAS